MFVENNNFYQYYRLSSAVSQWLVVPLAVASTCELMGFGLRKEALLGQVLDQAPYDDQPV